MKPLKLKELEIIIENIRQKYLESWKSEKKKEIEEKLRELIYIATNVISSESLENHMELLLKQQEIIVKSPQDTNAELIKNRLLDNLSKKVERKKLEEICEIKTQLTYLEKFEELKEPLENIETFKEFLSSVLKIFKESSELRSNLLELEVEISRMEEERKTSKIPQEWLKSSFPRDQRSKIKKIDISNENLNGHLDLGEFTNLEELYCGENELTFLDISKCGNLRRLHCPKNQLTELDLRNCNRLEYLHCSKNRLTNLQLPREKSNLKQLVIHENRLEQDLSFLSEFADLKEVYLGGNFFHGSLEYLKNLVRLRGLDISDSNIGYGLEYLPDSVEEFYSYIFTNPQAGVKRIQKELQSFVIDEKRGKYDWKEWKKVNTDLLSSQLNNKNNSNWRENKYPFKKFTEELTQEWMDCGFNKKQTREWLESGLQPNDADFAKWLRDELGTSPTGISTGIIASGDRVVDYLRDGYEKFSKGESIVLVSINERGIGGVSFFPINDNEFIEYLEEQGYNTKKILYCRDADPRLFWQELKKKYFSDRWSGIYLNFTMQMQKVWARRNFKCEEVKKWVEAGFKIIDADLCLWLRNKGISPEEVVKCDNKERLRKEYSDYTKSSEFLSIKDAEQWLNARYPSERAKRECKELNLAGNSSSAQQGSQVKLERYLNLKGFTNLERLNCDNNQLEKISLKKCQDLQDLSCQGNLLTGLNFLNKLPCPEKMICLDISSNNFDSSDLSVFSRFINLEVLKIGNMPWWKERMKKDEYNRFFGNLKPLKKLTKLKRLDIRGTDINDGLECLADSLETINCSNSCRKGAKVEKIANELWLYKEKNAIDPIEREGGNYKKWREINKYSEMDEKLHYSKLIDLLNESKNELINQVPWELTCNINAQEWLDQNYPFNSEERKNVRTLDISKKNLNGSLNLNGFANLRELNCGLNKITNLSFNDCPKLEKLSCNDNQISDIKFLSSIDPQKLNYLNMTDNNIIQSDLTVFSNFFNLETLWIGNGDKERMKKSCYNRFYGSLKPLKNLTKLQNLHVSGTDINKGLEYLPDSLQKLFCDPLQDDMRVKEINDVLKLYEKLIAFSHKKEDREFFTAHYIIDIEKWKEGDLVAHARERGEGAGWLTVVAEKNENGELDWIKDVRNKWVTNDSKKLSPSSSLPTKAIASVEDWLDQNYPKRERRVIKKLEIFGDIFSAEGSGLIGHLDLRDFENLEELDCSYNGNITSLDLSNCPKLKEINCSVNKLHELDLSNCQQIESLSCSENELTRINLSNVRQLRNLNCSGNELAKLNLSNCPKIERLSCHDNQLTELVFSPSFKISKESKDNEKDFKNKNLTYLDISNNKLLPTDLGLLCAFTNLEELRMGPSGQKEDGKEKERGEDVILNPLEKMINLERLTINGVNMDKDLKYLRIFDYSLGEIKSQRENIGELIIREWASKTRQKADAGLSQVNYEYIKNLIISENVFSEEKKNKKFPKVKEGEIEFFSTWWNPNCAIITNKNDKELFTIWLVIYEESFGKLEENLSIIKITKNLNFEKVRKKTKELKEKLDSDSPVLAIYSDIGFSPQIVIKKIFFTEKKKQTNESEFITLEEVKNNPDNYIKPLDIIWRKMPWTGGNYHVGVYLGDKRVVHVSAHSEKLLAKKFKKFAARIDTWEHFLKETKDGLIKHHILIPFKRPKRIIEHIAKAVFSKYGREEYDILSKNCEHFATLCVCGVAFSEQADKLKVLFGKVKLQEEIARSDKFFEMLELEKESDNWLKKIKKTDNGKLSLKKIEDDFEEKLSKDKDYGTSLPIEGYLFSPWKVKHSFERLALVEVRGVPHKREDVKSYPLKNQKELLSNAERNREVEERINSLLEIQNQLVEISLDDNDQESIPFVKEQLKEIKKTINKEYEVSIEKLNLLCELQKRITMLKIKNSQQPQIQIPPKK